MIRCPECGTENRDGSRFCGHCGRELDKLPGVICPNCGALNPASNVLCSDCLSPLHPSAGAEDEGAAAETGPAALPVEGEVAETKSAPGPGGTEVGAGESGVGEETPEGQAEAPEAAATPEVVPGPEVSAEPREPLEGIADALPLENIMALPHRSEGEAPREVPPEHEEQARLLSQVLVLPRLGEEVSRLAPHSRAALPHKAMRWALYFLLALAVALPLLMGSHRFGPSLLPRASVVGLFQAIESLPPDSTVLVSFDYDPGSADELAPGAGAVLDHLFRKGVSVVALGTMPAGAPLAWQQLDEAAARKGGLTYGDDYLLLGYVAGGESGLRRLTDGLALAFPTDYVERRDTGQFALIQRSPSLDDAALIITLAGDRGHVQRWIEQVQSPYGVPLAAVVSAAAEPGLSPYFSSGQLRGMVGGLPGMAEYEALCGCRGAASETADAQAAAYMVMILAVVLGNIAHLFGRTSSRKAGSRFAPPGSGE